MGEPACCYKESTMWRMFSGPLVGRMGRVVAGTTAGMGALWAFSQTANASEHLHPPSYPWEHNKMTKGLDMKSVRRGYEVYKGVCAQCHSLKLIAYRNFVDNIATEEEAKEWASEVRSLTDLMTLERCSNGQESLPITSRPRTPMTMPLDLPT